MALRFDILCDPDQNGGCGHIWEITCAIDDRDKPRSCPECRKRKSVRRLLSEPTVYVREIRTFGQQAEANERKLGHEQMQLRVEEDKRKRREAKAEAGRLLKERATKFREAKAAGELSVSAPPTPKARKGKKK